MILEVNSTFEERHIYFLELNTSSPPNPSPDRDQVPRPTRLAKNWPKDFHVSVLNSRKGSYSLTAYDPLYPQMPGPGSVDTTITLNSSKAHAKLVARVFSTSPALDPATMSVWQKTKFLASWWWVGLATFPRTVYQALFIWLKKGLPWVGRPEPRKDTMPRHADDTEVFIESIFRKYLRRIVEGTKKPVLVRYIPAGLIATAGEVMTSPFAQLMADEVEELELRILTSISTPVSCSTLIPWTLYSQNVTKAPRSQSQSQMYSLASHFPH
jgi:hypothetical protein